MTTDRKVTAAQAHVEALWAAEVKLARRRAGVRRSMATARASTGAEVLADVLAGGSGTATGRLAELQSELDELGEAVAQARAQRVDAIGALREAEGAVLAREAETRRSAAVEQRAREDEALRALVEVSDCPWAPTPADDVNLLAPSGEGTVPAAQVVWVPTPLSGRMLAEADDLASRAAAIATGRPPGGYDVHLQDEPGGGLVDGGLDDLLDAVEARGAMVVGPSLDEIAEWADPLVEAALARREQTITSPDQAPMGCPVRVDVCVAHGQLDLERSRVWLPAWDEPERYANDLRLLEDQAALIAQRQAREAQATAALELDVGATEAAA